MPSVSQKQHNLMELVAHDPSAAKRTGIPQSVGREYVHADHQREMKSGARSAPVTVVRRKKAER